MRLAACLHPSRRPAGFGRGGEFDDAQTDVPAVVEIAPQYSRRRSRSPGSRPPGSCCVRAKSGRRRTSASSTATSSSCGLSLAEEPSFPDQPGGLTSTSAAAPSVPVRFRGARARHRVAGQGVLYRAGRADRPLLSGRSQVAVSDPRSETANGQSASSRVQKWRARISPNPVRRRRRGGTAGPAAPSAR